MYVKHRSWIFLIFLLLACSKVRIIEPPEKAKQLSPLVVHKINVQNGKVRYLNFATDLPDNSYNLSCIDSSKADDVSQNKFLVKDKEIQLYFIEDYYSESKHRSCYLEDGRKFLEVSITQYPYQEEKLSVPKRKIILSAKDKSRVEKEWLAVQKVYQNSPDKFLFNSPFEIPLNSKVTSHFGKRRIFNNLKKSSHTGTDFRAAVGVKIPVANDGIVVFSGNLFYTGNVVIVDHGMDIYTLYAHLSRILVSQGDVVKKRQVIGLAGKTGRVSGPHLHWGVKMGGKSADGFTLFTQSVKQFAQENK